jgi:hypothetical protein
MRAGTIRVIFAAKLLKKLISTHLVYLVLKLLSVPVPAQGRYALTRLSVPQLDGIVEASTCYFCAVWRPRHGQDTAIAMRSVSTRSNSGRVRKLEFSFLISPI